MAKPEILQVQPVEAIRHFRAKGHHVGFDWRDTDAAEHLRSFTVAKAMRLDILQDIRRAVDRALAEGHSLQRFQNDLEPLLHSKGWWGRQPMKDPLTGETRTAQLGSPRRLQIIFDTNLRMSHAKGRWERIGRVAERRPWLRYIAVLDARTRPDHMDWHGTLLPWDHPFWETHYPPNGWRCRCTVQQLSDDDVDELGLDPFARPPTGWDETRPWTNKRTGTTVQVPRGIDPGFQHNVGLPDSAAPAQHLAEKIKAAPPDLAKAAEVKELDDWIAVGREERERLIESADAGDSAGFTERFRGALTAALRERRAAGTVAAKIGAGKGGKAAAKRIAKAVEVLPASWIEAGNKLPVVAGAPVKRAWYRRPQMGQPAEIRHSKAGDASTMIHEYTHHLQQAMPKLNEMFVQLHRRRTKGETLAPIYEWSKKEVGRKDKYIDAYAGKEYPDGGPLEVMTMGVQQVLDKVHGKEYLHKMAKDDPEMLDLVVGALLHYVP